MSHSNNTLLRKTGCIQGQLEFAKMSFTPHFSLKTRNQKMKVIVFIVFYRHRRIKLILKVRLKGKKSVRKINFYFFSRIWDGNVTPANHFLWRTRAVMAKYLYFFQYICTCINLSIYGIMLRLVFSMKISFGLS